MIDRLSDWQLAALAFGASFVTVYGILLAWA